MSDYVCYCGKEFSAVTSKVNIGHTTSCGCKRINTLSRIMATHGKTYTKEYNTFRGMLERCSNKNHRAYKNYGARGITVCDRWLNSFENFLEDMGEKPSSKHSLDRIDNNGNYEPSNCRWVDNKTQSTNQRTNLKIKYKGETKCLSRWAKHLNIKYNTLYARIKRGWSVDKSFNTEVG
jgi:hypothetical protein